MAFLLYQKAMSMQKTFFKQVKARQARLLMRMWKTSRDSLLFPEHIRPRTHPNPRNRDNCEVSALAFMTQFFDLAGCTVVTDTSPQQ